MTSNREKTTLDLKCFVSKFTQALEYGLTLFCMIASGERIKTRSLETVYHGPRSYSEDEIGRETEVSGPVKVSILRRLGACSPKKV